MEDHNTEQQDRNIDASESKKHQITERRRSCYADLPEEEKERRRQLSREAYRRRKLLKEETTKLRDGKNMKSDYGSISMSIDCPDERSTSITMLEENMIKDKEFGKDGSASNKEQINRRRKLCYAELPEEEKERRRQLSREAYKRRKLLKEETSNLLESKNKKCEKGSTSTTTDCAHERLMPLNMLGTSTEEGLSLQCTCYTCPCRAGNVDQDLISAPRPCSPPVRIVTATKDEKENAMEYGLPSSHTLNTVFLSGYLLFYLLDYTQTRDTTTIIVGFTVTCILVALIGFGRIYFGMHSIVDVVAGLVIGLVILSFWLLVHEHVDRFIVSGQNGRRRSKTSTPHQKRTKCFFKTKTTQLLFFCYMFLYFPFSKVS